MHGTVDGLTEQQRHVVRAAYRPAGLALRRNTTGAIALRAGLDEPTTEAVLGGLLARPGARVLLRERDPAGEHDFWVLLEEVEGLLGEPLA